MTKKILAIGHPTLDLGKPNQWGGGVTYSSLAVVRLAHTKVKILARISSDHRYAAEMKKLGIEVACLPVATAEKKGITTFENIYDGRGSRHQIVHRVQTPIRKQDLSSFPVIDKNTIVLIATVISEVDPALFPFLKDKAGLLVAAPQGYFRQVGQDGRVSQKKWEDIEALQFADATVLSEEDLTDETRFQNAWLEEIREYSPVTVLTRGEKGSIVYFGGKGEGIGIPAFKLKPPEIRSLTGAGDIFAGLFAVNFKADKRSEGPVKFKKHLKKIAAFSSLAAAATIAAAGGVEGGIYSIPTKKQLDQFLSGRKKRLHAYYQNF